VFQKCQNKRKNKTPPSSEQPATAVASEGKQETETEERTGEKNDKITIITERTEREIITLRDYLQQEKEIILEATGKIKDPKERKDFLLTTRSDNITEILKLESDAAVNEEQKETLKGHLDKLWET